MRRLRKRRAIARTLRREHVLAKTLEDYVDKWVAVVDSEIVAFADTLYDLQLLEPPSDAAFFMVSRGPCFFATAV